MKDKFEERVRLERQIIAHLISDYDGLIDFLDIETDEFTPHNQGIIKAIRESRTADPTIIASKLPDVPIDELWWISSEVFASSQNEFEATVEQLKDVIIREKIGNSLSRIDVLIKNWSSLSDIYNELNSIKIMWTVEKDLWTSLLELFQETKWEREVKIIPTGYSELDKLIGGYEECQVIVIWARPGVGKSMFAINLANNNILHWEKVALFSLEMNDKQVLRRLLAMNSGVWVWKLKSKVEGEALERVEKWFDRLSSQLENLFIYDDIHTIGELERKIRQLVHKHWVSIFYIDYLQLLRNPGIKNNPIEALTDISQRLKQLALELNITIVELSQLNREADKTMVKKASQLRWSWSIEQDADQVWLLDKQDEASNRVQVSVQKCRDWRIWDVELCQISDIMKITDLPINKPF